MDKAEKAAIETARGIKKVDDADQILTVKDIRIRLTSVPAGIFTEVRNKIPEPEIPVFRNEEYNRDEPNPNDPKYLAALDKTNEERAEAVIDACALFGVELVDGMPDDEVWLPKLKYMVKRGLLDLSKFDMSDPFEKEFVLKRFYLTDMGMINHIQRKSALTEEDIEQEGAPFRG